MSADKNAMSQAQGLAGQRPGISVFFPAYNDAGTIASMVIAALRTCQQLTDDYEVIVVENGSTDYTVEVLEDLAETHENLRVLTHREPLGYGGALKIGFREASKELVFYTDGDAQYDAHELALLVAALRPEVDIVQGYKIERHDPLFRIVIGRIYHWTVKLAFGLPVRDTDCDFRLIRKSALQRFTLKSNTGTIPVELVKRLHESGAVFAEVPVHHYHRAYGRSQFFNFKRLAATARQLMQLWVELVLVPKMTGRKPVKSVKPRMSVAASNPSLTYRTEAEAKAIQAASPGVTATGSRSTDGRASSVKTPGGKR
ncbi:MAG: glycosyltransferase family 2 protein [Chloroflexota bacterium]|nr:glycosyltransferase family 2 protein [Chloroflexota bacterium]